MTAREDLWTTATCPKFEVVELCQEVNAQKHLCRICGIDWNCVFQCIIYYIYEGKEKSTMVHVIET